jgi:hypothetical protein
MFADAVHSFSRSFIYSFANPSIHPSINPFQTLKYQQLRATLNMERSTGNEVQVWCLTVRGSGGAVPTKCPSSLHLHILNRTNERKTDTTGKDNRYNRQGQQVQ